MTDQSVSISGSGTEKNDTDGMKVDGSGSLGSASLINKVEELPYEGKPINESRTDGNGMKLEGTSDSHEGRDLEANEEKE
jgi:hypothetical protein